MSDERARLLSVLRERVLMITEAECVGAAACGMLCPGESERRGCNCAGPADCHFKNHPSYAAYVQYRGGQMNRKWRLPTPMFTAPEAGKMTLIRSSYDTLTGEYVFDTETME